MQQRERWEKISVDGYSENHISIERDWNEISGSPFSLQCQDNNRCDEGRKKTEIDERFLSDDKLLMHSWNGAAIESVSH